MPVRLVHLYDADMTIVRSKSGRKQRFTEPQTFDPQDVGFWCPGCRESLGRKEVVVFVGPDYKEAVICAEPGRRVIEADTVAETRRMDGQHLERRKLGIASGPQWQTRGPRPLERFKEHLRDERQRPGTLGPPMKKRYSWDCSCGAHPVMRGDTLADRLLTNRSREILCD